MKTINTFDIDGVIFMGIHDGVYPGKNDIIITGRSFQEKPETELMLKNKGITNKVIYNELPFSNKSRSSSGYHKAEAIKSLQEQGFSIGIHFEDDPIQAAVIRSMCDNVHVVLLQHELVEKENVRHVNE